jgi:N-acetylmuramoyl-L-alanine amidase
VENQKQPKGGQQMSKLICLDAGHGGKDSGAIGFGLKEKDVALDLAFRVSRKLAGYEGVAVTYTRSKDTYPELSERVEHANRMKADLFVSLHCNAGGGKAEGFESYVMAGAKTSAQYQSILHAKVMETLKKYEIKDRGKKVDTSSQHKGGLYVLRRTNMPAILLENLFIDNPRENKLLRNSAFLDALAQAIADGIAAIFGLKKKMTPQPNPPVQKPEARKLYKVQIGAFSSKEEAEKRMKEAKEKGFTDTFIVYE